MPDDSAKSCQVSCEKVKTQLIQQVLDLRKQEQKLKTALAEAKNHSRGYHAMPHCSSSPSLDAYRQRLVDANFRLIRARDEAIKISASKSRFLAAASHDLLQPINASRLLLEILSRTELNDKQQSLVDRLNQTTGAVIGLFQNLLNLSRIDALSEEVEVRPVTLDRIFRQIMLELSSLSINNEVDLRYVRTSALVQSNPVYLRQMLNNLIANAIKYTRKGKVVTGCRHLGNGMIRICVVDSGVGMAPEEQEKIYNEFFRGKNQINRRDGLGLGLTICLRLSKLLDHPLMCHSEFGRGTMFTVEVPFVSWNKPDRDRKKSLIQQIRVDDLTVKDASVLVVEDDPDIRYAMKMTIESWGTKPLICENLTDALQCLATESEKLCLIIADFHLQFGCLGTSVIKSIRAHLKRSVDAVLITADQSTMLQRQCRDLNCAFLQEPFSIKQL